MKKLLSLVLALLLIVLAIPATAEEPAIVLTAMQYELENQDIDFNNMWYFKRIEELTGVHVDFIEVKDADWKTQTNLMLASGEYTDMILRADIDVEDYGVTQHLLLPLDDYIEEYMPNYYSRLYMNSADASMYASDGHMYYIGYIIAQNVNHQGNWYINTKWLDELNLKVPTTIDELTEVLYAFKEARPDSYPLSADFNEWDITENITNMFASFGVADNPYLFYIDENEQVQFPAAQQGWYDCVEWLHGLWEDEILDHASFTQDSNGWGVKMNADQVGYTTYLRLLNTALTAETVENFTSILPPVADGYKVTVPSILELPSAGAYLTIACDTEEKIAAALTWLDAQMETENMMIAANGPINCGGDPIADTMHVAEDGKYNIDYVPENNGLYQIVPVTCGQFFAPGEYYSAVYQMPPHRVERYTTSQEYAAAGVLEYKSYEYLYKLVKLSAEDAVEASRLLTDLKKLVREGMTDFVMNGITEESYAAFIENCKTAGYERYIELYQDGYNAYLGK